MSLDKKRLELLELKQAQLAARKMTDPALEGQIAELAERLAQLRGAARAAARAAQGARAAQEEERRRDRRPAAADAGSGERPP